jgi:hypothetical protein
MHTSEFSKVVEVLFGNHSKRADSETTSSSVFHRMQSQIVGITQPNRNFVVSHNPPAPAKEN